MQLAFVYIGSRRNTTKRRGRDAVMRAFAKKFYLSKAWRDTRAYIFTRDMGLCVRCGKPGEIVHHKIHLTPQNINDTDITLSEDNLELLCRECHAIKHEGQAATAAGLMFDDEGNLVERKEEYES